MNKVPYSFNGLPIIRSSALPYQKVTLSEDVEVTDQFRTEMNQWLLEFFGMVHCMVIADPGSNKKCFVLSEYAFKQLRAEKYANYTSKVANEFFNGSDTREPKGLIARFRTGVDVQ